MCDTPLAVAVGIEQDIFIVATNALGGVKERNWWVALEPLEEAVRVQIVLPSSPTPVSVQLILVVGLRS